jgi:hypothetical protein
MVILPGYLLFLRKDGRLLWLLAGAVLYVLLFNLRYAVIDGLTYSLASIEGVAWLIIYCATTVAGAIALGWLIPMFGLSAFKTGSRKAAEIALGYIWFTIYMLAIPILFSFAFNGFTVTWTLPEFYSLFIGLLSLIQLLLVAAFGLVLIGVSAGIGWLVRTRS